MTSQRGFTLIEVLVAASIITVGLTAVAAGIHYALGVVETSRHETIAVFLAAQRLEEIKARALVDFATVTAANFAVENPVAGYPQHRRVVDLTPGPTGVAETLRVQVTVAYRPVGASPGQGERTVRLATVLSRRQ